MLTKKELKQYSAEARENYLPHISIDCVVFGFHEGEMKVLVLRVKNEEAWYLPGGFMLKEEPIETAASRILKERTGLDKIFLQQFHVFGDPERSKQHFDMYKDMMAGKDNWFTNRFLTIGYYALVDFAETNPSPDWLSAICTWRSLDDLPPFRLDHALILKTAL